MRCLTCGAEMVLMNVVRDETMAVAGFEHHTFMCSGCKDIERRLVFNKQSEDDLAPETIVQREPLVEHESPPILVHEQEEVVAAPPITPSMPLESERPGATRILRRMFSMLRGGADARR